MDVWMDGLTLRVHSFNLLCKKIVVKEQSIGKILCRMKLF